MPKFDYNIHEMNKVMSISIKYIHIIIQIRCSNEAKYTKLNITYIKKYNT